MCDAQVCAMQKAESSVNSRCFYSRVPSALVHSPPLSVRQPGSTAGQRRSPQPEALGCTPGLGQACLGALDLLEASRRLVSYSPRVLTGAPAGLQLLERDPTKRLGVTGNIKLHPFFKTINWTLLEKRQVEPPFKPKVVCDPTAAATHSTWAPAPLPRPSLRHLHAFLRSIPLAVPPP